MDERKLRRKYGWFKQEHTDEFTDPDVHRKALKTTLASIIRKHAPVLYRNRNVLPYYVVIDFEATCEAFNPSEYRHEIIEFPAVLVNSSTLEIEDRFRSLCRPSIKSKLSEFCVELTGITQEDIDAAKEFPAVLSAFEEWLKGHKLNEENFVIVTDGPWDPCRFLFVQCRLSGIPYPTWANQWLDLRKVFARFYNQKKTSLGAMLDFLGMTFEGRPHSGIDDATNIARILIQLICDGARLYANEKLAPAFRRERPLHEVMGELSLEAQREAIPQEAFTHRDVKIERSRMIHAITRTLDHQNCDNSHLPDDCESDKVTRTKHKSKSKKKGSRR